MVTFYLAPHFAWAAIPSREVKGWPHLDLFRAFFVFEPIFEKKHKNLEKFKNYIVMYPACLGPHVDGQACHILYRGLATIHLAACRVEPIMGQARVLPRRIKNSTRQLDILRCWFLVI
jgi:hypothetical protein